MSKSKGQNDYQNWPSKENFAYYKIPKKYSYSLTKKAGRTFLKESTKDGTMTNFLGTMRNIFEPIRRQIENFKTIEKDSHLIRNKQELVEPFNKNSINVLVRNFSSKKPLLLGNSSNASQNEIMVKEVSSV